MAVEYLGLSSLNGPLAVLEGVSGASYDEIVEMTVDGKEKKLGRIIEAYEDKAVIQVFESTGNMALKNTHTRLTGHPMEIGVSADMLGRTFDGLGNPIDGLGPILADKKLDVNGKPLNPVAREYPRNYIRTGISAIDGLMTLIRGQKLPIFSGNGLPHDQLAAQIVMQSSLGDNSDEKFAVVFAAMGVKYDVAEYFERTFRRVPLNDPMNAMVKRAVDIVGAIVGIVLFSPIMLIVAVLIKLTSPGPIIFCQERVGLHNRLFKMYKFRSMTVQDPGKEKSRWTTKGDARVTLIGKIIRRTSIDEVPQFFNILIGDMSLVGPRPERPFFVEKFKEEIPRYMIKHQVRPGLTGWAQVNGYRGDTSIIKRIEHDLYYIENWTLGLDFKIMFLTVFKGFINKNAY